MQRFIGTLSPSTSSQGLYMPRIRPIERTKRQPCQFWPLKEASSCALRTRILAKERNSMFQRHSLRGVPLSPFRVTSPTLVIGIPKLLISWVKAFLKTPVKMQVLAGREKCVFLSH